MLNAAEPAKFASGVVDIGMVAKDVEKTAKFYTEVVGLKEVKGFKAPAEKATAFGLTDNQPAKVRVFVLGDAPNSTRLKIMSFPSGREWRQTKNTSTPHWASVISPCVWKTWTRHWHG